MEAKKGKSMIYVIIIIAIGLWFLSGIYTVNDNGGEQAAILRFGKLVKIETNAGLHWHLPSPIEVIYKEKVKEIRNIEIGFRTLQAGSTTQRAQFKEIPEESLMLTSDEAMLNVETIVQYRINNIEYYLFKVDDQESTLTIAAEAVIRRVIASHVSDETLTTNKSGIQLEIQKDLQEICDSYFMGIAIEVVKLQDVNPPAEVQEAFIDVVNAREDKNSYINEAQEYENEIIPKARGNAAEILNKADGYKAKRIAEAEGDVAKFKAILEEYTKAKEVTKTRLYLEMLEEVLPKMKKFIVDDGNGTIKFLPLEDTTTKIVDVPNDGGVTQ